MPTLEFTWSVRGLGTILRWFLPRRASRGPPVIPVRTGSISVRVGKGLPLSLPAALSGRFQGEKERPGPHATSQVETFHLLAPRNHFSPLRSSHASLSSPDSLTTPPSASIVPGDGTPFVVSKLDETGCPGASMPLQMTGTQLSNVAGPLDSTDESPSHQNPCPRSRSPVIIRMMRSVHALPSCATESRTHTSRSSREHSTSPHRPWFHRYHPPWPSMRPKPPKPHGTDPVLFRFPPLLVSRMAR